MALREKGVRSVIALFQRTCSFQLINKPTIKTSTDFDKWRMADKREFTSLVVDRHSHFGKVTKREGLTLSTVREGLGKGKVPIAAHSQDGGA
jgi:hypothetical protein